MKKKKKDKQKKTVKRTIKFKLVLISSLLLIVATLTVGTISYVIAKNKLEDSGKLLLKNGVEMTLQYINENQELVFTGKLTLAEAQEKVRVFMLGAKQADGKRPINKSINLGENGYLFAYTQDGVEAAHPSLEGKNVLDMKDKKTSFLFVQDQIKIANNGGGYLEYYWTLPGSDKVAPKITYQKVDQNWNWVICAGTYLSDFNKEANAILGNTIILLLIVIAIGETLILLFARHISLPVRKINESLKEVSTGNLDVSEIHVKNTDETGELSKSFNAMISNLRNLLHSVKQSANTLSDSSDKLEVVIKENIESVNEVAASIQEIAATATSQAHDTENGVNHINNLAEQIELVSRISSDTNDLTVKAADLNEDGLNSVNFLSDKSKKNSDAASRANDIILEVDMNANEISTITDAISQIAEQTNLLALNAAIEAARAGEQGKGFAVVAEEVRKLASQSSESVTRVKELIDGIQNKSRAAVEAMEQGKKLAVEQDEAVKDVRNKFNEISEAIRKMAENISDIKSKSSVMSEKKEMMVEILQNLSTSTEESSASTEQVSASTEQQLSSMEDVSRHTDELNELAKKLLNEINKFNIK